jgi:2-octaprenyl-6-methoxyphenol hydroxylase
MTGTSGADTDVVVAGGGTVGVTLALALKRSLPALGVVVVDRERAPEDERASAIAAAAQRMLERLGVWDALAGHAQPIREMTVTDSRTSDAVRPVFLTFEGLVDGAPFAHMVPNRELGAALRSSAENAGVVFRANEVMGFEVDEAAVRVRLRAGAPIAAPLLVAADGVASPLRALAGIGVTELLYGQMGIVATVAHERPHNGRAEEHFLPGGPFAVLPLPGNRSSLVWTEPTESAARLMQADAATFQDELSRRFGHRLGAITTVGGRWRYPLGLVLARNLVKPRFALAGDAAHAIHPIAGQGLNLGFKDVAALAETIVEARRIGLDIGSLAVLERYEKWRRADVVLMGAVTDSLNRLFSNDLAPLRALRDVGLGLVERMPDLKRFFIRQAAGTAGDLPRLLRGEPI